MSADSQPKYPICWRKRQLGSGSDADTVTTYLEDEDDYVNDEAQWIETVLDAQADNQREQTATQGSHRHVNEAVQWIEVVLDAQADKHSEHDPEKQWIKHGSACLVFE